MISLFYLLNQKKLLGCSLTFVVNKKLLIFLLSAIFSCLYTTLFASSIINSRISTELEGKDIFVEGVVVNIPEAEADNWHFYLDISKARGLENNIVSDKQIDLKGKIKLGWYRTDQLIEAGQTLHLRVRLKRPNGFMNQGGFDYEKWLFTQRVKATGYVRKSNKNIVVSQAPWYSIDHFREKLQKKIILAIGDKPSTAIISALAIASRGDISDKQWSLFRQTGTSHLIAISGLHIGMVAGFSYLLVALIFWFFPVLYQYIPVRIAGAFLAIILATAYAILAGFTLPTQRSLIMVCGVVLALLQRQYLQPYKILSIAIILILLIDPFAAMTASFWLSFVAVILILLYVTKQQKKPRFSFISLQLMLSLGMFPLTILFFGTVSFISPIANLIAIPWVTIVIVPLVLLAMLFILFAPYLSEYLLQLASFNIDYLMKVLSYLNEFSYTSINLHSLSALQIFSLIITILFLFLPKKFPGKWLGLLLVIPVFISQPQNIKKQGEFEYTLLDIGQGLASVIKTKNHVLLYDVGPRVSQHFDTGRLVVVPYLKSRGIDHINKMVISHEDMDHRGGASAVLKDTIIDEVISSNMTFLPDIKKCLAGEYWQWDGVNFEFLSPDIDFNKNLSNNNLSCVLKVSNKYHSLLLVGDIEKWAEKYLLAHQYEKLKSDVLLVPHHGSQTSSTEDFLDAVDPVLALNSRGYRNKFKHPASVVKQRYERHGIPIIDNVSEGAITLFFPSDNKKFHINSFRKDNLRFWHRLE